MIHVFSTRGEDAEISRCETVRVTRVEQAVLERRRYFECMNKKQFESRYIQPPSEHDRRWQLAPLVAIDKKEEIIEEKKEKHMDIIRDAALREIDDAVDDVCVAKILGSLCEQEQMAGHTERAVGLLQAVIEISVAGLESFDMFWRSETARVGETAFSGFESWLAMHHQSNQQPLPRPEGAEYDTALDEALAELAALPSSAAANEKEVCMQEEKIKAVHSVSTLEGLRSIRSDGTAYSLAHGYRIRIALNTKNNKYSTIQRRYNTNEALRSKKVKNALALWARNELALDRTQWAPARLRETEDEERRVTFETISSFCKRPLTNFIALRCLLLHLLRAVGFESTRSTVFSSVPKNTYTDTWFLVHPSTMTQSRRTFIRNLLVFFLMRSSHTSGDESAFQEQLKAALVFLDSLSGSDWPQVRSHAKMLLQDSPQSALLWVSYAELETASGKPELGKQLIKAALQRLGPHPELLWAYARHTLGLYQNSTRDHSAFLQCINDLDDDSTQVSTEQTRARLDLRLRAALSSTSTQQQEDTLLLDDTLKLVPYAAVVAAFDLITLGTHAAARTIDDICTAFEDPQQEVSRARLQRIKTELLVTATAPTDPWFKAAFCPSTSPLEREDDTPVTAADFSHLVTTYPVSKMHWLLAFSRTPLRRTFSLTELLDIFNELLDRGIRIRDPRIVLIMNYAAGDEVSFDDENRRSESLSCLSSVNTSTSTNKTKKRRKFF